MIVLYVDRVPNGCDGLLSAMCDVVEESTSQSVQTDEAITSSSFMSNSGEYKFNITSE